jgi:hypothetical protein
MMNFSRTLVPITDGEVMIFGYDFLARQGSRDNAKRGR